jgi:hypothetical protein
MEGGPSPSQVRPITPDVSGGLGISAPQRASLPVFVTRPVLPESIPAISASIAKGPFTSDAMETARGRQIATDALGAGSTKEQCSTSGKSDGRSRLFSLSSLNGRRRFQSEVEAREGTEAERDSCEIPAPVEKPAALPGIAVPPGSTSWLNASVLTTGLLHDANKDKSEAKSDCKVM